jgi:MFS family permease
MADRRPFWGPLKHHNFRKFWLAIIASNLGGLVQGVAAAWMMTTITTSATMVALVQASTALPIMLFSIVAGAIADNFDRRRVMLAAQFFMFAMSALLALLALNGLVTPWILLGLTFFIGCGTAFNNPSWQVTISDLVPREDVPNVVSLNSIAVNITRSVGPAIGGAIVAISGVASAFSLNAVSYLALIAVLLGWKYPERTSKLPREQIAQAVVAGFRYVSMSHGLLKIYFRALCFGFSAVAVLALLPVVARNLMHGGPLDFGLLLCAFGVGALAAAALNSRLRETLSSENIVRLSFAGFALSEFTMSSTANFFINAGAVLIAGMCWVLALSLFNTIVQLSTPRWVVGRSLSFYQTAAFGGMAGGSWFWGIFAAKYGVEDAMLAASAFSLLGLTVGFIWKMPTFETLNLNPLNQFREPQLKLDILPRSGPIAIQVSYEIDDTDLDEFLILMAGRRRIRIRDGAKGWTLMRDLESPNRWIEMYHTPTWADYVRHNERRTMADAENSARLLAIHRGQVPLEVNRMIERQAIPESDDVFYQSHIDH